MIQSKKNLSQRIKMIKSYKQILLILASALVFTACSIKEPTIIIPKTDDLSELSKTANDDFLNQEKATKDYFDKYFKPWNSTKVSFPKLEAMWGQSYKNKKVYLENHQLATASWFDKQIENSNFNDYNILPKKAITQKDLLLVEDEVKKISLYLFSSPPITLFLIGTNPISKP